MRLSDADKVMVPIGNFFFKYRDGLFPIVLVCIAVAARPAPFLGDKRLDLFLDAAGLLVALAGQGVRVVTIGFAYVKRGGKDKKVYADRLVQEGIFAHSRNPMYLGNLLVIVGFALIHNSPWFYVVGLPFFFFAYLCIIATEESFLRRKFGDEYEAYCTRVNRLLPSLRGLAATLGEMTFDWKRVVRKEYGTLFTFVTCIVGLLVLERLTFGNFADERRFLTAIGVIWAAAACGWAVARVLKRKRLLGAD